jgi:UPF0755 protein
MRVTRFALWTALAALVLTGALVLWARSWLQTPLVGLQQTSVFEIARGASLQAVANELQQRNLLDQPRVWTIWGRLANRANRLKAGEYQLQPGLTPQTLLDLFNSGQVLLHSITFIEGSTFHDMRKAIKADPAIRAATPELSDEQIMAELGDAQLHPEGQFFPDTYHFPRGIGEVELLQIAHRRMRETLDQVWQQRAPDLPLAGAYEALILASIVEKETALKSERARIAGVFVERLRRGMRLQTDPTVIYGMLETYDGNIRRDDLLRDTPYNTYTRSGLPPTPIAMPGSDSLRAAVQPEVSGALFFVATGEGDGSHYFSKSLAEHDAAVKRYLNKLRQNSDPNSRHGPR